MGEVFIAKGSMNSRAISRLFLALLVVLFILIVWGAYVRLTGSGLSIPEWPIVNGSLLPPTSDSDWQAVYQKYYLEVFNITDDELPKSTQFLKQYKKQVKKITSIAVPYPVWYAFNALWEKYSKWSGGQLPPVFNSRSCEIYWKRIRYSNRKAKELLGWQPKVPMHDALQIFFSYMKAQYR